MLGSFIRLVDYMLVEALVDRTVGTVEELVAMLEAPRASADKTHKVCCSQRATWFPVACSRLSTNPCTELHQHRWLLARHDVPSH